MNPLHSKRLVISSMLLREHFRRFERRLPPTQVNKLLRITKSPLPLKYKLHPYTGPVSLQKPNPPPLEPVDSLPFAVERTISGNLPIYVKYNCNHTIKKTIIRRLSGDTDQFVEELKKVVSNSDVRKKVGKIEVAGVHKESI
jgi:hypothetical protein